MERDTNDEARTGSPDTDTARVGLQPGQRYRCDACGNVTRFDVEVTERARRFWHADLSGAGRLESEERETVVHAVQCRWCGSTDVAAEPRPASSDPVGRGSAIDGRPRPTA